MDGLEWIRNSEEGRGKEEPKQNEKGSSRRGRDVGAPADVGAPSLAEDPIPERSRETKERSRNSEKARHGLLTATGEIFSP
jgi:hypothetical protein